MMMTKIAQKLPTNSKNSNKKIANNYLYIIFVFAGLHFGRWLVYAQENKAFKRNGFAQVSVFLQIKMIPLT